MRILPPRTLPPEAPFERRHTPKPTDRWAEYRSCLRWDFGFTCPFCLQHDADVSGGLRAEGWGITTVEHREPRVAKPEKKGRYDNCIYACGRCNRARSRRPVEFAGRRLLDPTEDVWSDHFELAAGDRIEPREGDLDAEYTATAYDPNDELKVERRRARRRTIEDHRLLLVELPRESVRLLEIADRLRRDGDLDGFQQVVAAVRRYREAIQRALRDLRRHAAVPSDAPETCRCQTTDHHTLPEALARQTFELPDSL